MSGTKLKLVLIPDTGGLSIVNYQTLFAAALGLTPPWEVQNIKFDAAKNRLDIWVGFPDKSTFTCPACGLGDNPVYDTKEKTFHYGKLFIMVIMPSCSLCKVTN